MDLIQMLDAVTVFPCSLEKVDMSYCSEVSNSEQQTKDLVQECWNTEKSEIMISWQHEGGSLNEFFLHVTKNELDQGDIVMTKFCFRLYTSDPGQGTWSWAFTMTTHCLNLHLSYTMVNVRLLSKDGEPGLWEEFIYAQGAICSTPPNCNPWASDVSLIHHGTSGNVSVNVRKNIYVKEVFLILKEIKCNKTNNTERNEKMECEDAFCSAWLMNIPTGTYSLEIIPTCDEICEELRGCRQLYKEFALFLNPTGSPSLPPPVSTPFPPSVSSIIWISVIVALVVVLSVAVTVVGFLFMRWRRNVHIRQDAPVLEEDAVLREAIITQENNRLFDN
ncbi:hypothetical protein CHS0354_029648 [Potamilus streckersoni]|uniref:Uncharacterized protein n=1 Tax=Potamilus streckersoni TaxID=2493646 RepID=A0AAE0RTK5_9BIVA|nr:hypothetical protein CHS0354_029648 [Potamilus streckersoni]